MTQRRLVLIRHAKAELGRGTDAERALSPGGLRDATAIGEWLAQQNITPDHAAVSTALRTRQTWAQIAAGLPAAPEPAYDARIYDNSVADLLAVIRDAPARATTVVVVGHNPSMHELAGVPAFPTSAVAVYDVDDAWPDIPTGLGMLVVSAVPRAAEL